MKKITLFVFAACACTAGMAQLNNTGFETWVNNNESPVTYLVPQHWVSGDAVQAELNYLFFGDTTYTVSAVTRTSSSHSGQYAVQMGVAVSNEGDTLGGVVFSTDSVMQVVDAIFGGLPMGFPYTTRSSNLTGYYKFNRTNGDTAAIEVVMTKWNTSTNSRDTLASVMNYYFLTSTPNWTAFSVPISYMLPSNPDTAVILMGMYGHPHVGSALTVDDIGFTGLSSVQEENGMKAAVKVVPNPFTDEAVLHISNVQLQNASLEIFDLTGNRVRVIDEVTGNSISISREGLSDGMYFYQLINDGQIVATGKMTVE